ncbi:MAG: hypothetical protein ABL973_02315 [Micropepsaceae bacterium]
MAGIRFGVVAAVSVAGWCLGSSGAALAQQGYSGSQAEAQGDTGRDPYTFPNVKLCCERKPWKGRRRGGGGWHDGQTPAPGDGTALVNCGMPTEYKRSYGSVQEAVAGLRGSGTIFVVPGAACEISGLVLSGPITIATDRYAYGGRAKLVTTESCAFVSGGDNRASVTFGGIDLDGCVSVSSGELNLDEVNVAWRGHNAAVSVNGGSLSIRRSTVRAREAAVYAGSAGRIWIDDSRLATTSDGDQAVRLSAANIQMNGVQVKGARIGVLIDSVTESLQLNRLSVVRSEPEDPYPPTEHGEQGIVIGDGHAIQDLPWLSGMESRRIVIQSGSVSGYRVGISIGSGTSGIVQDMAINGGGVGISVGAGAFVQLVNNRINGTNVAGISLQPGARGTANRNLVRCAHGRCVCYGSDCTSRSDYVFGKGAFRMTDTDCDD